MNPHRVEYGDRYSDDSGWSRLLVVDTEAMKATVELSGCDMRIQLDELWWLVRAALAAREKLGMDKLEVGGPQEPQL